MPFGLKKAFLLSALLHACLLVLLWVETKPIIPKNSESQKFTMELVLPVQENPSEAKQNRDRPKTGTKKKIGRTNNPPIIPYALGPKTVDPGNYQEHLDSQATGQGEWQDNPVLHTLHNIDLPEYSENDLFFKTLLQQVDNHILYPKEFWENMIEGQFWIKILVNRRGCLLQILETSKQAPALRAYTILNIYYALSQDLPKKYWYSKEKDLAFRLQFKFEVTSLPDRINERSAHFFKNSFEIKRVEKIPNIIERVSRDYARYIPPITPTPLGPIIDFVQVYRIIQAWSDTDPRVKKKRRLRMTREKIAMMLEKAKRQHLKNEKKD